MSDVQNHLSFSEELGLLKHIERKGWVLRGVPCPERVAGHMYRMAVLSLTLDPVPGCDMNKVLKMCLVHDLPESRVGDITPHDKIPDDEKHRREREAMRDIAALLPPIPKETLIHLYSEYEKHESVEAKLTKDLDRFDMVQQAFEYEKSLRRSQRIVGKNGLILDHGKSGLIPDHGKSGLIPDHGKSGLIPDHGKSGLKDGVKHEKSHSAQLPDLSEFFDEENVLSRIENPQIKTWVKRIMDQRSLFFAATEIEEDPKCSSNHHTL